MRKDSPVLPIRNHSPALRATLCSLLTALVFALGSRAFAEKMVSLESPPPPQPAPVHQLPDPVVMEVMPDWECDDCCSRKYGLDEVLIQSMFGNSKCPWHPLTLSNLGEGWLQPWIRPPDGSSGAPRQGWLNAFDGFFTREFHLGYFAAFETPDGDVHRGLFQYQTPISRRMWIGLDVPFVVALDGNTGANDETDFGDLDITPRVMLHETQDLSVSAGVGVRIPTGEAETGGDVTALFPQVQFWADVGHAVSVRGKFGVETRVDGGLPDSEFIGAFAIGQTLTPHDFTPLGDFTYYLSVLERTTLDADSDRTIVTLTPGMRTHLGHNLFVLAGVEVPVTGPKPFDTQFLLLFVQGY
jgi:hypothetical protein